MTNQDSMKPVVFLAFANDEKHSLRLSKEVRQLRKQLKVADTLCELVVREDTTLNDILDVFQDSAYKHRIAIFHFSGHANSYQLLFESEDGKPAPVDANGFAAFLALQRGLHLVFLNGCSTKKQAQGLLDAGAKAVIATDRKINDATAIDFATRFYQDLSGDDGLYHAFGVAQTAIESKFGDAKHRAYLDEEDFGDAPPDTWPWDLYPPEPPEEIATWSLSQAANDPYFGLPELPLRPLPARPFLGLSYFQEKHAEIFFGRGWQIRTLFKLITDDDLSSNPIILLYGQSGVGKSSLLAAGLLPRLKQVAVVRYIRREEANNNLTAALYKASGQSPPSVPSKRGGPNLVDSWRTQESKEKPLVIILDQVEEFHTRPGPNEAQEMADFLDTLESIFGEDFDRWPRGKLILGFRKEWLAEIRDLTGKRDLPAPKEMFLKHLDEDGIVEAVVGPATRPRLKAQYELEVIDKLPDVLADDLLADQGSAIAPTLQIILTKLWENATGKPKVFDRDLYDNLRLQPANFLGQLLDKQLGELAGDHPKESASGLVLDLLAYHTTEVGTTQQRERSELETAYNHHSAETLKKLVQSCKDRYLLVTPAGDVDEEAPDDTRLTHDTLGPLVRARFDVSQKPGQRTYRLLKNRAGEWQGGKTGTLFSSYDLAIIENGQDGMRAWDEAERRLIEASRKGRDKRKRNRRILGGLGIGAILIIVGLTVFGIKQLINSQNNLRTAQHNLQRFSETLLNLTFKSDEDPQRDLLLAIEAVRAAQAAGGDNPPKSANVLRDALSKVSGTVISDASKQASTIAVSPAESKWLVVGNNEGQLWLWDLVSQLPDESPMSLPGHESRINLAAISHDNAYLLTADNGGVNYVWKLNALSEAPSQLSGPPVSLQKVVFSPNDNWLAAVDEQNLAVYLWQRDSDEWVERHLTIPTEEETRRGALTVAFSPDNRWLAAGGGDGAVWLWSLTQNLNPKPISLDKAQGTISDIVFTLNNQLIASGWDGTIHIWDVSSETPEWERELIDFDRDVTQVMVVHGESIFAGNSSGSIYRLDLRVVGTQTEQLLTPVHQGGEMTIALSSNGYWMLSGGEDGVVRLWDLFSRVDMNVTLLDILLGSTLQSHFLAKHEPGPTQVQITADSRWAFSLGVDQIVRAWDLEKGSPSAGSIVLGGFRGEFDSSAIVSDGSLVIGGNYESVKVWDVTEEKPKEVLLDTDTIFESPVVASGMENQRLLIGDQFSGKLEIIDLTTGKPIAKTSLDDRISTVTLSDDGRWGVIGSWNGVIYLWDAHQQEKPKEIDVLADTYISSIYIDTDKQWLGVHARAYEPADAHVDADNSSFRSWTFDTQSDIKASSHDCSVTADSNKSVWAVSFSDDKKWLALGGRTDGGAGFIYLCDLQTGGSKTERIEDDAVDAIAVRSEEPILATGHRSGEIRLWRQSSSGLEPTVFDNSIPVQLIGPNPPVDETDFIDDLAFAHNNRLILLSSLDVQVWNLNNEQLETRIAFSDDPFSFILLARLSADNRWLITSEADGLSQQIRLWPLQMDDLLDIACKSTGRNFTQTEWDFYFPGEEYEPTCAEWPIHPSIILTD